MQDVNNWENCVQGRGGMGEFSTLSRKYSCKPQTVLKNKIYSLKKKKGKKKVSVSVLEATTLTVVETEFNRRMLSKPR